MAQVGVYLAGRKHIWRHVIMLFFITLLVLPLAATSRTFAEEALLIQLKSRVFTPEQGVESALLQQQQSAVAGGRIHALMQLWQIPTESERAALENAGVQLLAYVPDNTWFVSMPAGLNVQSTALDSVRWLGAIQPADRMAPAVQAGQIMQTNADNTVSLDVRFFADVGTVAAMQILEQHGAVLEAKAWDFHRATVRVDAQAITDLAAVDGVQWITNAAPPKTTLNDGSRARTNVDVVQSSYGLDGTGVDLGEWDGGYVDSHVDFSGRLTVVDVGVPLGSHATHVAGTMAGDGSNSVSQGGSALQWRGMAPGADIFSYYWDNNLTDHNGAINTYGIELSQNSWGYVIGSAYGNCNMYGNYDWDAPDYDDIITGLYGKRISVIFAAGNERDDGDCGMSGPPYINYANVGPPSTAKNMIVVGASNSNDDSMTDFSSWGPVDDGRIKPDVVAPGCESTGEGYIQSTMPGNIYGGPGWCGTSMAAPAVSGISALLIEQYRNTFGVDPLPSTVKAILVETAVDLDNGTSYYNSGPDYASGYGRVDAQAVADLIIAQAVEEDSVGNGGVDAFSFTVAPGTPVVKVTLAWDDEPGTVNATPALVNNLDLVLIDPNGTSHYPWVLNPANPANNATKGVDSLNNVEQVEVNSPISGTWQVEVAGSSVPTGLQDYSLAGESFGSAIVDVVIEYDSLDVDDNNAGNSNGNDDGVVDAGETIELYVTLLNSGTDNGLSVNGCLTEDSPFVSGFIFNDCSDYGNILAGGTADNTNDFDFEVDPNTPDGHIINFTMNVTAGNGGPWTVTFPVPVNNDNSGVLQVALISDQDELTAVTPLLNDMGIIPDVYNNNWNGTQGIYTSDSTLLSGYDIVVWYGSGYTYGRLTTQQEHDALEQFVQTGGRLLVTGYDTIGSPTDTLLADLVRSTLSGDGPFTFNYTVTDGTHPIMDGPFGSFPTGTALTAAHSDHDQAEADTTRNATTVAELSGGRDKIMATDIDTTDVGSGRIVYWNGNRNVRDWVGQTVVAALTNSSQESETKRDANGQAPLSNEALVAAADRLDPDTVPAAANYDGNGPALHLSNVALAALPAANSLAPLADDSTTFIATGDTINVQTDPWWWHDGDYAEGVRTLSVDSVEHVNYNMVIGDNFLSGTGHVDLTLSINGVAVGNFSVLPGELVKNVSFDFPAIAGPTYTVRLEETNTVDSGAGSITLPVDLSTLVLSNSQPEIFKNTIVWLAAGTGSGDEPNNTPGDCTPLLFDIPYSGLINPAGDWDYYCFDGLAGQTIAGDIDASDIGSPLDPWLTLFDTDGTTILTENDDFGSLDSYLEYTLPADGIYYLRVRSYGHPCCGGADYFYELLLTEAITIGTFPFIDDIESGVNGWTSAGLWHQVEDGSSPYPNSYSPTHSWWYGQDSTGDYATGSANSGSLTTPAIPIPVGIQAALTFRQWYETEPAALMPQSVYFDIYHDTDGNDTITSGGLYEEWANELVNAGFTIDQYNQPINLATLSGYEVLALFDPEVSLSNAEIAAINDFMQQGGRVVVLGEGSNFDGVNTVLNALTAPHGIVLNSDQVLDASDNDGQDFWPLITSFTDAGPFVRNVNTAVWYAGSSISLSGSAMALASGDNDAGAAAIVLADAAAGLNEDGTGNSGLQIEPNAITPGAPVVMAYAPVGTGQLIALSDSGLWTDDDPDSDSTIALNEYNNLQLAFQVFGNQIDSPNWDQKWVQISVDGGPFQNLTQVTGGPMNIWHQQSVDLSPYDGSTVQLRFYFDTIDAVLNGFRGWYIDDVSIEPVSDAGPIVYAGQDIDDDNVDNSSGNGNGIANAGETIELYVTLENQGTTDATNVAVTNITENSPYVNGFIFNTDSAYGDIAAGGTAVNSNDFDFAIAPSAPAGHIIHFTMDITADNGGPWTTSFDVVVGGGTVPPGPVVYNDHIVDDDNNGQSAGNGDGVPNPGETVELYVELFNAGAGTALGVNACLTENSPYVNGFLFNGCSGYGDIAGGGSALNFTDFEFEIDPLTPSGHVIDFTIVATAFNGGPWTSSFGMIVIGTGPSLRLEPADQDVPLSGGNFLVNVVIDNAADLGAFEFDFEYNPAIVHVVDVNLGPFPGSTGRSVSEVGPNINNGAGVTAYGGFSTGSASGPNGTGVLASIELDPQAEGDSDLFLTNIQLTDTDLPPTIFTPPDAMGHVQVTNTFFADVDGDGDVDIVDVQLVAAHFGCVWPDACYDPLDDLNNDLQINIVDIQIVACYWGWPSGDFSACYTPALSSVASHVEAATGVGLQPETAIAERTDETIFMTLEATNANNLGGFGFELHYDPNLVEINSITLGDLLLSTGRPLWESPTNGIDNVTGKAIYNFATLGPSPDGPSGDGTLVTIEVTPRGAGIATLDLQNVILADIYANEQSTTVTDGSVHIATPVLSISKTADAERVSPGGQLTYILTVENLSLLNEATGVVITDKLPAHTAFVSAGSGGTLVGNQVEWSGLTVPAAGSVTVQFTVAVAVDYEGEIVNDTYNVVSTEGASAVGALLQTTVGPAKIYLPFVTRP